MTKYALSKGVELWLLPANTSHYLQPLDGTPFARFKQNIHSSVYLAKISSTLSNVVDRELFFAIAYKSEDDAFTKHSIAAAFSSCGLCPWDPFLIRKNALANVGKYSSSSELLKSDAVEAATAIVRSFRDSAGTLKSTVRSTKVKLDKNRVFDPEMIVEIADREEEERKVKVAELLDQEILRTCQHVGCEGERKGRKRWAECELCAFVLCPDHENE